MSRRAVFLDRDGVINVCPARGEYVLRWEDFRFIPQIADWIRLFNALDVLVIVVTNQRCVALGLASQAEVNAIHARMTVELAQAGARIDDVFCCPHAKDACDCRKPKPGLIYQAREKWGINLSTSLVIGDSDLDAELAHACGVRFLRVCQGRLVDR